VPSHLKWSSGPGGCAHCPTAYVQNCSPGCAVGAGSGLRIGGARIGTRQHHDLFRAQPMSRLARLRHRRPPYLFDLDHASQIWPGHARKSGRLPPMYRVAREQFCTHNRRSTGPCSPEISQNKTRRDWRGVLRVLASQQRPPRRPANGHQRLFSKTDPTSISGLSTVQPIAGPSPPEPSEIFSSARNNLMPLPSVVQRDWPTIYLGRVLRPRVERTR
jgi:hypothetical protein